MAFTDKNIVIYPNRGAGANIPPKIDFIGADASLGPQTISASAHPYNGGTISFAGLMGELFSINNGSGTIYSVNDVSGIPSIEVRENGSVLLAPYLGDLLIGGAPSDNLAKVSIHSAKPSALSMLAQFRNDNTGTGVAAIGFNVAGSVANEVSAIKGGIGFERQYPQGGGALVFYNRSSTDTLSFTKDDEYMAISKDGAVTFAGKAGTPGFRVDRVPNQVNYAQAIGSISGHASYGLLAMGADAGPSLALSSKGSGNIGLHTNGYANIGLLISHTANAVDYPIITGSASGFLNYYAGGASADAHQRFYTKGAGGFSFNTGGWIDNTQLTISHTANSINRLRISGSIAAYPYITGDGSSPNVAAIIASKGQETIFFQSHGTAYNQVIITATANAVNYTQMTGGIAGTRTYTTGAGADTNVGINFNAKGNEFVTFSTSNWLQAVIAPRSNATDYLAISGGTTVASVDMWAAGTSTNVPMTLFSKGAGSLMFYANGARQFNVGPAANAVNCVEIIGGATGNSPIVKSIGNDANASLYLHSKGTWGIGFGTGSGQQFVIGNSTSPVNWMHVVGAIAGNAPAFYTEGSSTDITMAYRAKGGGSHAFDSRGSIAFIAWNPSASSVNYMQAQGSPTGSAPTLQIYGTEANRELDLFAKGVVGVRMRNDNGYGFVVSAAANAVNYGQCNGRESGGPASFYALGNDANISFEASAQGNASVDFRTNGGLRQFSVAPTASAVNYLFATGAATTVRPLSGVAGTDPNIGMDYRVKGAEYHVFRTGPTFDMQFVIAPVTNSVNAVYAYGGATGTYVEQHALGADAAVPFYHSSKGASWHSFRVAGATQFAVGMGTAAINYFEARGGSNETCSMYAFGSNANIYANYYAKEGGTHQFYSRNKLVLALYSPTANAVNFLQMENSDSGLPVTIRPYGVDTNIDMSLLTKGTGVLRFGTWTSNADAAINGYVTIKTADGTVRKLATIA